MVKTKADIRKDILLLRKSLDTDDVRQLSHIISNKLYVHDEYIKAQNVLIYSDYKNEVQTSDIIEHSLSINKNVYLPTVDGNTMDFYCISSLSDISAGYMGIKEPKSDIDRIYVDASNSIIIMPLSVYDRSGNRIGYGGGYYDRYLSIHTKLTKIGLAYSFQEYNNIPKEITDIELDYIINENEVIKIKND